MAQEQRKRVVALTLNITVMTNFMESVVTQTINSFCNSIGQQVGIKEVSHEVEIEYSVKKLKIKEPA